MKMVYERPLMRAEAFAVNSYCATNCTKGRDDRINSVLNPVGGDWFYNVWWSDSNGDHNVKFFNTTKVDGSVSDSWTGSVKNKDGSETHYVLDMDKVGASGAVYLDKDGDGGRDQGLAANGAGDWFTEDAPEFNFRAKNHSF